MYETPPEVRLDTSLEALLSGAHRAASPGVLATLVATSGSTYRKPGARMLIMADGRVFGLLSGGCLEADLGLHAREVLTSGQPRAVEYDMRGPDDVLFGLGAGCEGAMRVLLEPMGPGTRASAALANAGAATGGGRPTSLVMVHDSHGIGLGTYDPATLASVASDEAATLQVAAAQVFGERASTQTRFESGGYGGRAFVQFLAPPPHLLICGAGPDAQPVASTAVSLGWRVTVVDHRPAYAMPGRFPGADVKRVVPRELRAAIALADCHAAVVMSHHLHSDVAYLSALAEVSSPTYVGLLGPAARRQRIAHDMGEIFERLQPRVRGPVGIDVGAVTPEGIALSIISQIHGWLAGRSVQSPAGGLAPVPNK